MKHISRYILTLVALFAMSAGAWAQETSWTNIVSNSDMEGTDVSCFYVKENAKGAENMYIARITEGIGVDNSRAIRVLSNGDEVETWDTQFFIRLPYELPAGTKYKLSFDYKADKEADADFQCANEPGEYIIWYIDENDKSDFSFTTSWQSFSREYTVPNDCNGQKHSDGDWLDNFQTIYFSLALNKVATEFIIDNVKVEIPTEVLNNLTPKPVTDPSLMLTYVTKDAANQWSFDMPGYDMELTPEYAPAAKWATEGDAVLAPTAIEGVIAGTTDAIVKAGTVATGQGTAMYFATTNKELTAEQAAQANGWLSTLPTAVGYDDATTVYVWYYIQGADTPEGEEATDKNTFNDSEISSLTVSVLSNKFDITFNAANANTIDGQNGKATVKVKTGDAEAVDKTADIDAEHKLEGIKMGSEVKLNANTGYKFRKVEVKKQAADRAAAEATAEDIGKVIGADGNIYADAATATAAGATAVAMIAYVGSETGVDGYTHGLALALTDEASTMNWTNATGASGAAAHTPAAPTTTSSWMLPSKDQWNKMITAAGGYTALRDGFSGIAGASNLQSNFYWSSTEDDSNNANAWLYRFSNGQWYHDSKGYGDIMVRACLAF